METNYLCGRPRDIFRRDVEAGTLVVIANKPTSSCRSACLYNAEALDTPLVKLFVDTIKRHRDDYMARQHAA